MKYFGLKILDIYIIKKFLGTFFFAILLIIGIAVVFDFSEKIDDFLENEAPFRAIIFNYYLNFIPYFAVLFSSLFTFIAVLFFTSRMAYNTEIIAILSSGISFRRLMLPYFISALVISIFAFVLNNYVIPSANAERFEFEDTYYHDGPIRFKDRDVHKQVRPGIFIYMESYSTTSLVGHNFSMEKFEDGKLVSKLISKYVRWDSIKNKWNIRDYYIRNFDGIDESLVFGESIDSTLHIYPEDFSRRGNVVETMSVQELSRFIELQKMQGATNIEQLLIEKHERIAFPFSSFILTLIAVSVSSRKVRGGIGGHIGIGLAISFGYILFMQFSAQFAVSGVMSPFLASWLPNILFAFVAVFLYKMAPK